MESLDIADTTYLITVLTLNGLGFFIVVICYAQIYFSLGVETRHGRNAMGEMTIAKKMALLVRFFSLFFKKIQEFFNPPKGFYKFRMLGSNSIFRSDSARRLSTHQCDKVKNSSCIFLSIKLLCKSLLVCHTHGTISS